MVKGFYKYAKTVSKRTYDNAGTPWRIRIWENVFSEGASEYLVSLTRKPLGTILEAGQKEYWSGYLRNPPNPGDSNFLLDPPWNPPWKCETGNNKEIRAATFEETGLPNTVLIDIIQDMRVHRFFLNPAPLS